MKAIGSDSPDPLVGLYRRRLRQMDALHDGDQLADAAASVLSQLPAGSLTLLSTSPQGVALAAVCAATRGDSTRWSALDLLDPGPQDTGGVVVVEPVDAGPGWRRSVSARLPSARFAFPEGRTHAAPLAA
jgi:hypothetical protein